MNLPNTLFPVFMFTVAHFHLAGRSLLGASISHFLTAPLNFHVFLPTKFVSFIFNDSLWLSGSVKK